MTGRSVVGIMNQLLAEWASARIPEHMQGLQLGIEMPMSCSAIEAKKPVRAKHLPEELADFWSTFASAKLFKDVTYGQWGLRMLDYETSNRRTREFNRERPQDTERGDRVIGEFIGDLEQLLIRCDTSNADCGNILVVLPASPRMEWYRVADCLSSFLEKYRSHEGQKYWEPQFVDRRSDSNADASRKATGD